MGDPDTPETTADPSCSVCEYLALGGQKLRAVERPYAPRPSGRESRARTVGLGAEGWIVSGESDPNPDDHVSRPWTSPASCTLQLPKWERWRLYRCSRCSRRPLRHRAVVVLRHRSTWREAGRSSSRCRFGSRTSEIPRLEHRGHPLGTATPDAVLPLVGDPASAAVGEPASPTARGTIAVASGPHAVPPSDWSHWNVAGRTVEIARHRIGNVTGASGPTRVGPHPSARRVPSSMKTTSAANRLARARDPSFSRPRTPRKCAQEANARCATFVRSRAHETAARWLRSAPCSTLLTLALR